MAHPDSLYCLVGSFHLVDADMFHEQDGEIMNEVIAKLTHLPTKPISLSLSLSLRFLPLRNLSFPLISKQFNTSRLI